MMKLFMASHSQYVASLILDLHVGHIGGEVQKSILSILLWASAVVGELHCHCLVIPERLVASQELGRYATFLATVYICQLFFGIYKCLGWLPELRRLGGKVLVKKVEEPTHAGLPSKCQSSVCVV